MESDPYIRELKDRVKLHPGDLNLRFRLGKALFDKHHYQEALPEIQRAKTEPELKDIATALQIQIFEKLGIAPDQ